MGLQEWIDTGVQKARERIVLAVFALITLLLLVIWRAVPASVWDRVSEATPKRALWALLGLAAIAICVLTALFLQNRRKQKETAQHLAQALEPPESPAPQYLRMYGLLWDDDLNPCCPADETPLTFLMRSATGGFDILQCASCKARFPIHDDEVGNLTIGQAKESIRAKLLQA